MAGSPSALHHASLTQRRGSWELVTSAITVTDRHTDLGLRQHEGAIPGFSPAGALVTDEPGSQGKKRKKGDGRDNPDEHVFCSSLRIPIPLRASPYHGNSRGNIGSADGLLEINEVWVRAGSLGKIRPWQPAAAWLLMHHRNFAIYRALTTGREPNLRLSVPAGGKLAPTRQKTVFNAETRPVHPDARTH